MAIGGVSIGDSPVSFSLVCQTVWMYRFFVAMDSPVSFSLVCQTDGCASSFWPWIVLSLSLWSVIQYPVWMYRFFVAMVFFINLCQYDGTFLGHAVVEVVSQRAGLCYFTVAEGHKFCQNRFPPHCFHCLAGDRMSFCRGPGFIFDLCSFLSRHK